MKGRKFLLYTIFILVTIAAVTMAIVFFRNEIANFFVEIKDKLDEKKYHSSGEYADYVD